MSIGKYAEPTSVSGQSNDGEAGGACASARVWLDLDQEQLDTAYNPSAWAPNMDIVIRRCETNTELVRDRLGEPARISYGESAHETLELTRAEGERAPVHLFFHGGAWKGSNAAQWGFLAENFVSRGIHFVAPDFINVLQTGGSLTPMVDQVRRSIAWVYSHAASIGADPDRIYLSGHSSGAHLAAMALVTDWEGEYGLPSDIIKGAVLVGGMYDLKPVRLSFRRSYVTFDDEIEERLSPQRHLNMLNAPVAVVNGMMEGPEFVRQSKDFADAIGRAGKSVRLITGQEYNHFEMVETLGNPLGLAGAAALNQATG